MCFRLFEKENYVNDLTFDAIKTKKSCEWCEHKSTNENKVYIIKESSKYYNRRMCTLCIYDKERRISEGKKKILKDKNNILFYFNF